MDYDEKLQIIQEGLEKGLAALEISVGIIERALPLLKGYRDLIKSDYEGRNGISDSFKADYEALNVLISDLEENPTD